MKRFVFRLETLLTHRETLEELREQDYSLAQARHEEEKERLSSLETQYRQTVAERPVAEGGVRFDAPAIQSREKYLESLQARITGQTERVEVARLIAEEMRVQMVAARQAREAVTRLRDKDLAEYRIEMERKAQEQLDEIASVRFVRQQAVEIEARARTAAWQQDKSGAGDAGDAAIPIEERTA